MRIKPITFKQASEFINMHHRHNKATVGCKFCIGLFDDNKLVGCAVCGRPVARYLDDGLTCEINRLCTDGTRNACSKLYGACCRIAKEMGYEKIITYTLASENGSSLRASNFECEGVAGGTHWTGKRYQEIQLSFFENEKVEEMKQKWIRYLQKQGGKR